MGRFLYRLGVWRAERLSRYYNNKTDVPQTFTQFEIVDILSNLSKPIDPELVEEASKRLTKLFKRPKP